MKLILSALIMITLMPVYVFGQTPTFDVRAVVNNVSCDDSAIFIDIEVKATDDVSNFNVAHQNYRFTYNDNAITNPSINQELTISGFVQTSNPSTFSLYAGHTLTGSSGNLISYNVYLAGGSGYPLNANEWVGVGQVRFDVVDMNECLGIEFNSTAPEDFPNTIVIGKENGSLFLADGGGFSGDNTCLSTACNTVDPVEAMYDLRFNQFTVDCDNRVVLVDLEIKASGSAFNAGFMNLRLSFNAGAIGNPVIDEEYNFSGFVSDGSSFSFYTPHTITGSIGSLVSYNVTLGGGDGTLVTTTEWTPVGRLAFEIFEPNQCSDFRWHDSFDFPSTIVVEKKNGSFYPIEGNSYDILDGCVIESCPQFKSAEEAIYNITMSPVPAIDYIKMQFGSVEASDANVVLFDAQGRKLSQQKISVLEGTNYHIVDVMSLPAGVFTVMIQMGEYRYAKQVMKIAP